MALSGRERIGLGVLACIAAISVYGFWPSGETGAGVRPATPAGRPARGTAAAAAVPEVRLDALRVDRGRPGRVGRDLFRFGSRIVPARAAAPPPPPPPTPSTPVAPPPPPVPSGPPPLPPIPLKFAAMLTQGPVKVAVLLDALGHSIYGKEGETIEGRYKIWRIGADAVEMSYLDGRGRQTIRMSGT